MGKRANHSPDRGLGARRQCDFADGKSYLRGRVIGYTPQKLLVLEIYEGTAPIRNAVATLAFQPLAPQRSAVQMRITFEPKMGVLGRLMMPAMKRRFAQILGQLLAGDASYVESNAAVAAA